MEASNIIKAIKSIKEDCRYRELDESAQGVVTRIDCDKFYERIMGLVELFDIVDDNKE